MWCIASYFNSSIVHTVVRSFSIQTLCALWISCMPRELTFGKWCFRKSSCVLLSTLKCVICELISGSGKGLKKTQSSVNLRNPLVSQVPCSLPVQVSGAASFHHECVPITKLAWDIIECPWRMTTYPGACWEVVVGGHMLKLMSPAFTGVCVLNICLRIPSCLPDSAVSSCGFQSGSHIG